MKKLLFLTTILFAAFFVSCSEEYDDSALTNRVDNLESRVERLEELCAQMNTNISSLQTIVNALQQKDFITTVAPINKDGKEVGYSITFSSGKSITIYHGNDGKDGSDGEDGKDGEDGTDGHTPIIGVKQASDGVYYWTVDGEWLLDEDGEKIRAEGKDGLNGGKDGEDGADGVTPQLKIENNYWYISYDQGQTWTQLGQATGDKGDPGLGGDSMFTDVDYYNGDYVIFTLSNGAQIKVPTWASFERLQTLCNQMNTNIESLQAILTALQNNDYIKEITPIVENGQEIGYTIIFTKSKPITIYHGKDGKDGKDGEDGSDGKDGSDGHTPIIGVKKDVDGIYYWTLDGDWLLDADGNKLKAVGTDGKDGADGKDGQNGTDGKDGANGEDGKDGINGTDGKDGVDGAPGKDGQNGTNGKDGVTPQLKIEDDYWYVSYDNGATWTKLGKAKGEDGKDGTDGKDGQDGKDGVDGKDGKDGSSGDNVFQDVTQDANNVYFVLSDGTTITIPKSASAENLVLTYIPRYSDGKATVFYTEKSDSYVEFDFEVSPVSAAQQIASNWQSWATVKAVYTETRAAVSLIDMPIISCTADSQAGIITVKASGKNLSDDFFAGAEDACARLSITVDNAKYTSDYVPMVAKQSIKLSDYALSATFVVSSSTKYFPENIAGDANPLVAIDYGDGTIGTELQHTYAVAGEYDVKFYFQKPITIIRKNAFSYISIKSICIPNDVVKIEYGAFYNSSWLETITFEISSQLTQIEDFAFGSTKIKEIIIPSSVTEIGHSVFVGCVNLEHIDVASPNTLYYAWSMGNQSRGSVLSDNNEKIIAYAAASTLEEFKTNTLGTVIGQNSFVQCKYLKTFDMNWIDKIEDLNFRFCDKLEEINLSKTSTIGENVLTNCKSLKTINAQDASAIGTDCFCNNESLMEITLGCAELKTIDTIGNSNVSLQTISIPSGIENISNSFNGCAAIAEVYCKATTPPTLTDSFDAITDSAKIYVPVGSGAAYKAADGWKEYASIIEEKAM